MNIAFEQESVYVLTDQDGKKHRFTVKSEWNGLTELRDDSGGLLVVVMPRKGPFAAFLIGPLGEVFTGTQDGEKRMRIIGGSPGLVERFGPRNDAPLAATGRNGGAA